MDITEVPSKMPFTDYLRANQAINFRYRNNSLKGNRPSALRAGMERVRGLFGAMPQIERNSQAPPRPIPQTEIIVALTNVSRAFDDDQE
jgi:hypothetical protein